jgi:hypothetical protein
MILSIIHTTSRPFRLAPVGTVHSMPPRQFFARGMGSLKMVEVARKHGRPTETLRLGDIAGRLDESGKAPRRHRLGLQREIGKRNGSLGALPVLRYFRRVRRDKTLAAANTDHVFRPTGGKQGRTIPLLHRQGSSHRRRRAQQLWATSAECTGTASSPWLIGTFISDFLGQIYRSIPADNRRIGEASPPSDRSAAEPPTSGARLHLE